MKVESAGKDEELDEILPDCAPVVLIDCGLCSTQCASKDILVHHFTRCHPGIKQSLLYKVIEKIWYSKSNIRLIAEIKEYKGGAHTIHLKI